MTFRLDPYAGIDLAFFSLLIPLAFAFGPSATKGLLRYNCFIGEAYSENRSCRHTSVFCHYPTLTRVPPILRPRAFPPRNIDDFSGYLTQVDWIYNRPDFHRYSSIRSSSHQLPLSIPDCLPAYPIEHY